MASNQRDGAKWLDLLSEEDVAFIKRFVLASGSLKEMAEIYGITYPTVRLRLDRLIEKIKVVDSQQPMSEFERVARALCAEGKVDINTLKTLLTAQKKEMEAQNETSNHSP
ncbi:MAG TPA: DUF2089 family protein [Sedimentisphaerales bacterium]|nr:DUF2089 family protein [Sedimentisphaerales bacterium]